MFKNALGGWKKIDATTKGIALAMTALIVVREKWTTQHKKSLQETKEFPVGNKA
jgi:hypothetical protein